MTPKKIIRIILQNQEWLILLGIALLVFPARAPSLEQPFGNDEGANAYHARLITRGEPLYGTHHPAHQLPGIYYTYALAFVLLGDSLWAVKFFLILWVIATAYLLYRLGSLVFGKFSGLVAAFFYIVLSSHVQLAGASAQNELFANLPRVAAVLTLIYLVRRQATAWKFMFVGLLGAVTFLFRANYLTPLALAGFILTVQLWQHKKIATPLKQGGWLIAGFALGLLPVAFYFWAVGLLPRFLLVFELGTKYTGSYKTIMPPPYQPYWPLYPLYGLFQTNPLFLIYASLGILIIIFSKQQRSLAAVSIIIWFILSYAQTTVTRILFYHYYLLITPALALLAAHPIPRITQVIKQKSPISGRLFAPLVGLILLALPFWFSGEENLVYYKLYLEYKSGDQTYEDFLHKGRPIEGPKLVLVQRLADYVKKRTSADDFIYYWSGNVQIYYLADRQPPLDVIWPFNVGATGPPERVLDEKTKYIILGHSNRVREVPQWLRAGVEQHYVLETTIEGRQVYRRVD